MTYATFSRDFGHGFEISLTSKLLINTIIKKIWLYPRSEAWSQHGVKTVQMSFYLYIKLIVRTLINLLTLFLGREIQQTAFNKHEYLFVCKLSFLKCAIEMK